MSWRSVREGRATGRRRRHACERGQVAVFVVLMWAAFMALAALVIDGGKVLSAHVRAINQAEGAARAAAQELDTDEYRASGTKQIDPSRAQQRAVEYLQAYQGRDNTALERIEVNGDVVTVEVRLEQELAIMQIAGVDQVTVHGTADGRAVRGITGDEQF